LRTPPRTVLRKDDECDQDVGEEEEEEDAVVLIFVVVKTTDLSLSLSLSLFGVRLARSQLAVPFATRSFLFFFVESLAKRKEEKNF
jgi:hypothetical protein